MVRRPLAGPDDIVADGILNQERPFRQNPPMNGVGGVGLVRAGDTRIKDLTLNSKRR